MAWFGETFGDSLNSLKGQITKITKEVLAENDENDSSEETQTLQDRYKELEAYCASKDLEVSSLREENLKLSQQFQAEIEYLRNENKRLRRNGDVSFKGFEITDDQIQQVCELENQLQQLREEKDQLSQCLEELQNEHQNNLMEVIRVRDFYKNEMERIKSEYEKLKLGGEEVDKLRREVEKLQLQVEADQKEKEESFLTIKKEIVEHENLKGKLERLVSEIQALNEEKHKTDAENKKFKMENENLSKQLLELEGRLKDLNLNTNDKEMERLQKKIDVLELEKEKNEDLSKQISYFKDFEVESQKILKNFLNRLNCNVVEEETGYKLLIKTVDFFENFLRQKEEAEGKLREINENLQGELLYLKNECQNLQVELVTTREELKLALEAQQADCMIQSQTDDVKRLEQEVVRLANLLEVKVAELDGIGKARDGLEQEMNILKSMAGKREAELEKEVALWKNSIGAKEEQFTKLYEEKVEKEERLKFVESENLNLKEELGQKQKELEEVLVKKSNLEDLEGQLENLKAEVIVKETLATELKEANEVLNSDLKKLDEEMRKWKDACVDLEVDRESLQDNKTTLENEISKLNDEITKNSEEISKLQHENAAMTQTIKNQNQDLTGMRKYVEEVNRLQQENAALSQALQNQNQNMADVSKYAEEISRLQQENVMMCQALQSQSSANEISKYAEEISRLQQENAAMSQALQNQGKYVEEISRLQQELQNVSNYAEEISRLQQENAELSQSLQQQSQDLEIREENNQLRVQLSEMQMSPIENLKLPDDQPIQQHRRTRSDANFETSSRSEILESEIEKLKNILHQEQSKYKHLQNEHQELKEKESSMRKELERLRIHLVEVEDHYTAEAVESEKTINEYKTKLNAAEEQLKNSSTIYKSANFRANQHLESLQSQIKLISVQRDDLQAKLSAAEDEVQKHAASLTSLQIVLEQFQQDKEREIEAIVTKYEYQIQLSHKRFKELETEIESWKKQLADAKNGLNAASRLGEQLEKKSQQIYQLEEELKRLKEESAGMESRLSVANQSSVGKIDKPLIKNLVVGYISSPQSDRKSQVLRIMASVLDFNQEERAKLGVDSANSGWLSNLLHPKSDHAQNTQSLSEAFVRFLESESRPQPHMKLLPEQSQGDKPGSSRTSPKPSLLLSEFVLPTFNSSQANESSSILKDVLRDS